MIGPPIGTEIDGLRRALGDRQLGRIDPHVTIVPPINLDDDELVDALAVVQAAARQRSPMDLTIGPVETFGEHSPVRFLAVDPWEPVTALHDACWAGVLDRPVRRSFHPHVTVDIGGGVTGGPDPALEVLAGYRVEVTIDRVTVLEHLDDEDGRRWETFNGYRFGVG